MMCQYIFRTFSGSECDSSGQNFCLLRYRSDLYSLQDIAKVSIQYMGVDLHIKTICESFVICKKRSLTQALNIVASGYATGTNSTGFRQHRCQGGPHLCCTLAQRTVSVVVAVVLQLSSDFRIHRVAWG